MTHRLRYIQYRVGQKTGHFLLYMMTLEGTAYIRTFSILSGVIVFSMLPHLITMSISSQKPYYSENTITFNYCTQNSQPTSVCQQQLNMFIGWSRKKTAQTLICHHFATVSNMVFTKMLRNQVVSQNEQILNTVIKYTLFGSW